MINNSYHRLIYSFEFPDNSVYVGLTYNPQERKNEHLNSKRIKKSTVYKHIEKTGLKPEFKELTGFLNKNLASFKEGEFLEKYKLDGWSILNKVKTGGLGGKRRFWTKKKCLHVALKCKHKYQFIRNYNGAYEAALKNGWIDESCKHMVKPINTNKKYDYNTCLNIAKQCLSRSEFQKKYSNVYQSARKILWLDDCCKHMEIPNLMWNRDNCIKEGLKYSKRSVFKKMSSGAYNRAQKMGWLEDCCKHMNNLTKKSIYNK